MIRDLTAQFSNWYNARSKQAKAALLCGFCLAFLLLLGLSIRYGHYDGPNLSNQMPVNIGRPSGHEFRDSLNHQKQ